MHQKNLKNIEDIGFIELDQRDVVRHEVVRKIINAYEEKNKTNFFCKSNLWSKRMRKNKKHCIKNNFN